MKLADLYVEFRAKGLARLSASMGVLRTKLKAANAQLANIARIARRAFMIAAAAAAGAVYAAAKFEKQLAMVATMLDKSTMVFMQEYERGLRRLSVQYGESTATLSKGLYDILSATIDASKALGVLEVATKAAIAGGTSAAAMTKAITTILNSYQMSADQAAEVSDKLFAIIKRGVITGEELSGSIGKAAAMAAIAGLSFDELGAAIATITRAGLSADQAMTAVVGMIRSFLKPTTEGAKMAKELGFELSSAGLRAEKLTGIFAKLTKLSAEQLAVLFPNIRGLKGVAAAMQDLEGFTYDVNLSMNSLGLTQEALIKRSKTLDFRLKQIKQSFLAMAVAVGDQLMPFMNKLINAFKNLSEKAKMMEWAKWAAGVIKWTLAIGGLIIALKVLVGILTLLMVHPAVAIFGLIAIAVGALAIKMGALDGIVNGLKNRFDELTKSTKSYLAAQKEVVEKITLTTGERMRAGMPKEEARKQEIKDLMERIELMKKEQAGAEKWVQSRKRRVEHFNKEIKKEEKAQGYDVTTGLYGGEKGAGAKRIRNLQGYLRTSRKAYKEAIRERIKIDVGYAASYEMIDKKIRGIHDARRKDEAEAAKRAAEKGLEPAADIAAKIASGEIIEKQPMVTWWAEQAAKARIKALEKQIPAMKRIATEFGQAMIPPEEQWNMRLAEVEKRFGKESPFYRATANLMEAALAAKTTAGRWVSITDLYKQIQSAVMRPEKKFDKAALDLYNKMLIQLEQQTELLKREKVAAFAA